MADAKQESPWSGSKQRISEMARLRLTVYRAYFLT